MCTAYVDEGSVPAHKHATTETIALDEHVRVSNCVRSVAREFGVEEVAK